MKRYASIFTLILFFLSGTFGFLFAQETDISGTWVGETYVPDMLEPDELTLILEKDNGEYFGTISDSMGMADEAECTDIVLEGDVLTFTFQIFTGYEFLEVYVDLTIDGDTMTGYWETSDGSMGDLELQKVYE